jgi:hypothetical protein
MSKYTARTSEKRTTWGMLTSKLEREMVGKPRGKWENNNKTTLRLLAWGCKD